MERCGCDTYLVTDVKWENVLSILVCNPHTQPHNRRCDRWEKWRSLGKQNCAKQDSTNILLLLMFPQFFRRGCSEAVSYVPVPVHLDSEVSDVMVFDTVHYGTVPLHIPRD